MEAFASGLIKIEGHIALQAGYVPFRSPLMANMPSQAEKTTPCASGTCKKAANLRWRPFQECYTAWPKWSHHFGRRCDRPPLLFRFFSTGGKNLMSNHPSRFPKTPPLSLGRNGCPKGSECAHRLSLLARRGDRGDWNARHPRHQQS